MHHVISKIFFLATQMSSDYNCFIAFCRLYVVETVLLDYRAQRMYREISIS